MNRVSGSLAVLAGMFLMLPGLFAMIHATSADVAAMPTWLIRDLVVSTLSGGALMFWGASHIRHRELEMHELKPVRVRSRS